MENKFSSLSEKNLKLPDSGPNLDLPPWIPSTGTKEPNIENKPPLISQGPPKEIVNEGISIADKHSPKGLSISEEKNLNNDFPSWIPKPEKETSKFDPNSNTTNNELPPWIPVPTAKEPVNELPVWIPQGNLENDTQEIESTSFPIWIPKKDADQNDENKNFPKKGEKFEENEKSSEKIKKLENNTKEILPPWVPQIEGNKGQMKNSEVLPMPSKPEKKGNLPPWAPVKDQEKANQIAKQEKNISKGNEAIPPWVNVSSEKGIKPTKATEELPPWMNMESDQDPHEIKSNKGAEDLPPWIEAPFSKDKIGNVKKNETISEGHTLKKENDKKREELPPWISPPIIQENKEKQSKAKINEELPPWINPQVEKEEIPDKAIAKNLPEWIPGPETSKKSEFPVPQNILSNEAPKTAPNIKIPSEGIKNNAKDTSENVPPWFQNSEVSPPKVPANNTKNSELPPWISAPSTEKVQSPEIPPWIIPPPSDLNEKPKPQLKINNVPLPPIQKKEVKKSTEPESNLPPWIVQNESPEPIPVQESEKKPTWLSLEPQFSPKNHPLFNSNDVPVWITEQDVSKGPSKINSNKETQENLPSWAPKNEIKTQKQVNFRDESPSELPPWLSANQSQIPSISPPSVSLPQIQKKSPVKEEFIPTVTETVVIKEKKLSFQKKLTREIIDKKATGINEAVHEKPKNSSSKTGFIQFGDIICLSSSEQVMLKDKNSLKLKQELYKGICIGDGISYSDLECILRKIVKNQTHNVQFRQCLFRVEPARQYGFLNIYNQYMKGNVRQDFEKILKSQADEEQEGNEAEAEITFGRTVTYGERVQLRHIHSNSFVTISKTIANEHGALKIRLDSLGSESSWLEIIPGNKLRQEGEPVKYIDSFKLVSKIEKSVNYLHMSTSLLSSEEDRCELNASEQASLWKAKKYIAVRDLKLNPLYISTGDSFRILHKESETYLSAVPLNIETMLPEEIKEIAAENEEEARCIVSDAKSHGPANKSTEVYLEKHKSSRGLWELERLNPFKGGVATSHEMFRLKNVATGLYLHVVNSKSISPDFTNITNINTFKLIQNTPGDILSFKTNLKIKQDETNTYIGLVENLITIDTYFKGTNIEKHREFSLKTFENPKMALQTTFVFEDEIEKNSSHVYQISTILQSMLEIYKKINIWGFLEGEGGYISSYDIAVSTEIDLENTVRKGEELMENLKEKILNTKNLFIEDHQVSINDSGLLDLLLKLLQLIDKRQTFNQKTIVRKKTNALLKFDYKALMKIRTQSILLCPQMISKKYLNRLAAKIYKIIFLCIKDNSICRQTVKQYSNFLCTQLLQYKEEVSQILKEIFKESSHSFDKSSMNEFKMWANQLRSLNEKEGNWADQILIIKIITSLCYDRNRGIKIFQDIIRQYMIDEDVFFIDINYGQDEIEFKILPIDESEEDFMANNPSLNFSNHEGLAHFIPASNLRFEIKGYCCAVLNLLASLALSKNHISRKTIKKKFKFTREKLLFQINSPNLGAKFKTSFLHLFRTLFVDISKSDSFSEKNKRIIQWDEEHKVIIKDFVKPKPWISSTSEWVKEFFLAKTLTIELGTNISQQAKFVIEMLNLVEALIESEHVEYEFIYKISEKIALLLPDYSSDCMIKINESDHWCYIMKKQLNQNKILASQVTEKVISFFSLVSKYKIFEQVCNFITVHSTQKRSSEEFALVYNKFNLNFEVNAQQNLNLFLLNVLLSQNNNYVKSLALEELVMIFNQRLAIKAELDEIVILFNQDMADLYYDIEKAVKSLEQYIAELINLVGLEMIVEDKKIKSVLYEIKVCLLLLQQIMSTSSTPQKLALAQSICRNLKVHTIIIDFLNMKFPWIDEITPYRKTIDEDFLLLYRTIIVTLSKFTFMNPKNQEIVYNNISEIICFIGNSIRVSRLLSNIASSQRATAKIEHIIFYLFHLISLEDDNPNHSYMKILKNLIIDEKFQIYIATQTTIVKWILKNQTIMNLYLVENNWNLLKYSKKNEKFHSVFISLLSLSAVQNSFVTLQCRNLISFPILSRELLNNFTPLPLKIRYLMFILNVYFVNISNEIHAEYDLHELFPILMTIVWRDLQNFSLYMADLIGIIQKGKYPIVIRRSEKLNLKVTISEDFQKNDIELSPDEEEALQFWKYLINVKPWKKEHGSGLLIFIKELSIELKLSRFNPNEEFKQIIENIVFEIEKLKAKIEGLSVHNSRMDFEFFIENISLCLYEIPAYSFEAEETNVQELKVSRCFEELMESIKAHLEREEISIEEFFKEKLQINSETISTRSLAFKLKNELKNINLNTIHTGLCRALKDSEVMICIEDFKKFIMKDSNFKLLTIGKNTISQNIEFFINKNSDWTHNRNELVVLMDAIKATIIEKNLANYEYSSLLHFCKLLCNAFRKENYQKYLFELFTQMIKIENKKVANANKNRIQILQDALEEAGIGSMAFNNIKEGIPLDSVIASIQLLHVLLLHNNDSFKKTIFSLIEQPKFCFQFFSYIKLCIKDFKDTLARSNAPLTSRRLKSVQTENNSRTKELKLNLCKSLLYLVELLCEDSSDGFQDLFREQNHLDTHIVSIDIVSEMINLLDSLTGIIDIKTHSDASQKNGCGILALQCLRTLTALCEGPCIKNQKEIGSNTKIYKFINWFMEDSIFYLSAEYENYIEILNWMVKLLNSLIECESDIETMKIVTEETGIDNLLRCCSRIYEKYVFFQETQIYRGERFYNMWWLNIFKSDILPVDMFTVKIIDIAFSIFNFCLALKERFSNHPKLREICYSKIPHSSKIKSSKVFNVDEKYVKMSAFNFYLENSSKVEMVFNEKLIRIFFKKPFMTRFLTEKSGRHLIIGIENSSYQAKIEEFFKRAQRYKQEMIYQQRLERYPLVAKFSSHWDLYEKIAYYLTLVINILMIAFIKDINYNQVFEENYSFAAPFYILSGFQIFFASISFLAYLFEYSPIIYRAPKAIKNEKYNSEFKRIDGTLLQKEVKIFSKIVNQKTPFQGFLQVILHPRIFYQFLYFIISFLAIQNLMWYGLLILDSIRRSEILKNVLKSISLNYKQLLLTMILGVIIVYLFTVFYFLYFSSYYDPSNGLYCESLGGCFVNTLNRGLRGQGGMGTVLDPANRYSFDYAPRILIDMAFFIILIVVLLKVIFGIIIDTFAELRDIRKEEIKNLEETCFVCGRNKFEFNIRRISWKKHIKEDHNIHAYLAFLIYIMIKKQDLNGVEKYVKRQVLSNEIDFFPKTSMELQKFEEVSEEIPEVTYEERFSKIKSKISSITGIS